MWEQQPGEAIFDLRLSGPNQPDRRTTTVPWTLVFRKAASDADVDQS